MNRLLSKGYQPLLTLLFGVAAFMFWWLRYPSALAFQEQMQLFLFDGSYLASRLSEPGGVARYVAEFLTQFDNVVALGAAIIAVLYMLIQRLTWRLMRPAHEMWYALSFIPVVMIWLLMGDENVLLTTPVAFVLSLAAMLACPKNQRLRIAYLVVGLPVIYWIVGPLSVIVGLYVALMPEAGGKVKWWKRAALALLALVYSYVFVAVSAVLMPYPRLRLLLGMGYYRFVEALPYLMVAAAVVCLFLSLAGEWLKKGFLKSRQTLWGVLGCVVLAIVTAVLVPVYYDQQKYDLMEYDYLVRGNKWDAIIAKSQQNQTRLPMSVCATNLALAMKGQLGDRAFEFYQRGIGGLLPPFERNFVSLHLTGEAYFQLGLVNTAQRFAFEAMEAIPNYNKSGRAVKRLAETNLINGQYEVARKYLKMLKKTIFYRNWAKRTEALLGDETAISQHPVYGRMRKMRLDEDFLFSEYEIDKICGRLFVHNNQNNVAMQYLILSPLLQGEIDKFVSYIQIVQEKTRYNPRACQEAIAYTFMRNGQNPPQGLVNPMIVQQLQRFVQTYKNAGKGSPELQEFKNTVWYYLIGEE